MKEEIKEILEKFDKVLENYELDKKIGQMSVDSICHLFPYETITIKDYITNLQEQLHKASLDIQELTERDLMCPTSCDKLTNLQEENERLKEENKHIFANVNDDQLLRSNAMNYAEAQDYKTRNEKAIEYINNINGGIVCSNFNPYLDYLLNLLQGKSDE